MNQANIFNTKFFFAALTIAIMLGCDNEQSLLVDGLKCQSNKDLQSYLDEFKSYLVKDENFFTILEKDGEFVIEPFNDNYSYKERNISLDYNYSTNILLVDNEVHDIANIDSILTDRLTRHLIDEGTPLNNLGLNDYESRSSGFVINFIKYSEDKSEISDSDTLSMLHLLKMTSCSIDNIRNYVCKKLLNKEYRTVTLEERKIVDNIVPKDFHVFYFKNYKIYIPEPIKIDNIYP